jgi:anti-sigma factor RsiW
MNCELAHERIVLAAYRELSDEQAHELDRHLAACPECSVEQEQLQALKTLATAYPVVEPDPNLVGRSRMRLDEALDALPPKRWYERFGQRIVNNFANLQAALVAALLLLIVGAGAGTLGGYEYSQARLAHAAARKPALPAGSTTASSEQVVASPGASAEVANISSIVRQPNSEMVEVTYNQVVPQRIQGSLDDPAIRQLLMLASENASSQGVRDDSVGLLAAECRAGHGCQGQGIREALWANLDTGFCIPEVNLPDGADRHAVC